MIRPAAATTLGVAVALLAGCGGDGASAAASEPTSSAAPRAANASAAGRGRTIKVVRSQFGSILADGRGQAVYLFDKEKTSKAECYGACARAWPPVLTRGRPMAGKGVRGGLLGTTRRRGGARQVTLGGKPLYYYVHDTPGRVLCHNANEFGGLWLVIRPDGTPAP